MTAESKIRVLLIDDDEDEFVIVEDLLSEIITEFDLSWEGNYDDGLNKIIQEDFDVYLIDYRLGPRTGLDLIREVKEKGILAPMILLTGQGDRKIDLEAMQLGASDYLVKTEVNADSLSRSIRYAITSTQNVLELRTKERKYRSLFEKSVDPIYQINEEFRINDLNDSFIALLGYQQQELQNIPLKKLFHTEGQYEAYRSRLTRDGEIRDMEVELLTKDELVKTCSINGVALKDNNGFTYGYQGIIHDMSLRKKAEHDLLIAEKLAMTGNIARSIAHEVRNPLTNLNLALEQLEDDLSDSEDGEHTIYLDIIQRNANRIDQLITQMLESSKPKELDLIPVSLNSIMEDVLEMTRDRIKLRGITSSTAMDDNIPIMRMDPDQLKTAILNIVINAIESIEGNEGHLQVGTFQSQQNVVVYVEDNGKGIPKEELKKLFDPFFTGKQGGMGLGLTSTQNIINSHKGTIEVQSKLGEGTRFEISFPSQ